MLDELTLSSVTTETDWLAMQELLAAAGLPASADRHQAKAFKLSRQAELACAYGALEGQGEDVLLRSVVLKKSERGQGIGRVLVQSLADNARLTGARRLWLLTTTAEGFFLSARFVRVARTDAPESVQRTTEFAGICPTSALCMMKAL